MFQLTIISAAFVAEMFVPASYLAYWAGLRAVPASTRTHQESLASVNHPEGA